MKILVINSGSSSVKCALFDQKQLLWKRVAERIGEKKSLVRFDDKQKEIDLPDHKAALTVLLEEIKGIDGIGHRIVHGGEKLKSPVVINAEILKQIQEASRFAPLHSMPNLIGIEIAQKMLPSVSHVAVFDTAAYIGLAPKAFLYGIPKEFYEKHRIRRYGFHGINHSYVAKEAAKVLGKKGKIISCHLGGGSSISAFEDGVSKDTSMGLTPLEGVVMTTRSGDIDPSIVLYLIEELGFSAKEVGDILNKKSGLFGLSGKKDMRDIIAIAEKDRWAKIAIEIFVYRIQQTIGAYVAALNGVDAIVFTGGIGENLPSIREKVMANFGYIGAAIAKEKNAQNLPIFSSADSKVILLNIKANEELVIATETEKLLGK